MDLNKRKKSSVLKFFIPLAIIFGIPLGALAQLGPSNTGGYHDRLNITGASQRIGIYNNESANAEYLIVPTNAAATEPLLLSIEVSGNVASPAGYTQTGPSLQNDPRIVRRRAMQADFLTRKGGTDTGAPLSPSTGVPHGQQPSVGDLWRLNSSLSSQCDAGHSTSGVVSWVGNNIIVVTDEENPAVTLSGTDATNRQNALNAIDTSVYPTIINKFGQPADQDNNGKVVLFITQGVNQLDAPATSAPTPGLYLPRDLLSRQECSTGNVGEVIYILAPDPTGAVNSNVRTVSYVNGSMAQTFARELAHMVIDSHRIASNSPFEESWLDEALGGMALEQVFYANSMGLAPFGNIVLSDLTSGPYASSRVAAFNTYQNVLYSGLKSWLQQPYSAGVVDNSKMSAASTGAQWAFLRYVADRYSAPSVASEADFIKSLVDSRVTGIANLRLVINAEPIDWLKDFLIAAYLDDNTKVGALGTSNSYSMASWNYRSVYGGLGGFPIRDIALAVDGSATVQLKPLGSSSYYRFSIAPGATAFLSLTPTIGSHDGRYSVLRLSSSSPTLDVPAPPKNLSLTGAPQSAIVDWTNSTENSADATVQYTATARQGNTDIGFCTTVVSAKKCTITGLVDGTAYTINIMAKNAAGNSSYIDAGVVTPQDTRNSQTIAFADPGPQQVGMPLTLTASATSGLEVFFSVSQGCTLTGNTLSFATAGSGVCTITATQPGDAASWLAAPDVTYALNVTKGINTITFSAQTNQPYVQNGTFQLSPLAAASSGLPVSYGSTTPAVCTVSGALVTVVAAGSCTISATQAGDANWSAAADKSQTLQITAVQPEAPTGVSATPGDSAATVQWVLPTNTGGSPIGSFKVTAVQDASKTCSTTGALSCTVESLTNGIPYTFTVVTTNTSSKSSSPSQPSNSVTPVRRTHSDAQLQASFTGGGSTCTFDSASTVAAAAVTGLPTDVQAMSPQFEFTLKGCNVRSAVQLQIDYSAGLTGPAAALQYWKRDSAGHWFAYQNMQISGNRVTLTLTDGGPGDADGVENGEIVDPGVVVQVAAAVTPVPVPVSSLWSLGLLGALIAGLSVFGTRRRLT